MSFKQFTSKSEALGEPVGFAWNDQRFQCKQQVATGKLIRFMRSGAEGGGSSIDAMMEFLRDVLMPNDVDRFFALLDDETSGLTFTILADIVGYLTEVYSGERPTGGPSSATSSSQSTGGGSTDGSLHGAPTYSRSQPTEG